MLFGAKHRVLGRSCCRLSPNDRTPRPPRPSGVRRRRSARRASPAWRDPRASRSRAAPGSRGTPRSGDVAVPAAPRRLLPRDRPGHPSDQAIPSRMSLSETTSARHPGPHEHPVEDQRAGTDDVGAAGAHDRAAPAARPRSCRAGGRRTPAPPARSAWTGRSRRGRTTAGRGRQRAIVVTVPATPTTVAAEPRSTPQPSSSPSMSATQAAISAVVGGSVWRCRSCSRTEPMSSETPATGPPAPDAGPSTSSVEPPPMSTTRTGGSTGSRRLRTAPSKDSAASSSPDSTSGSHAEPRRTPSEKTAALAASRVAEVAQKRIAVTSWAASRAAYSSRRRTSAPAPRRPARRWGRRPGRAAPCATRAPPPTAGRRSAA